MTRAEIDEIKNRQYKKQRKLSYFLKDKHNQ